MVHVPYWSYSRIWYMAPILWFCWSLRLGLLGARAEALAGKVRAWLWPQARRLRIPLLERAGDLVIGEKLVSRTLGRFKSAMAQLRGLSSLVINCLLTPLAPLRRSVDVTFMTPPNAAPPRTKAQAKPSKFRLNSGTLRF